MDESRWYNSAEAYRAIQALVREGRYQEAVDRSQRVLQEGGLGRKHSARLHSQICWLYIEQMHKACPAAALHGEEAVRLAELVHDQWIRTEALARLVHTYCRLGDLDRARAAFREVARELEQNDSALVGGTAALLQLEATIALAAGEEEACLSALCLAEEFSGAHAPAMRSRACLQRIFALLEFGRHDEAADLLRCTGPTAQAPPDALLEWDLARAWLAAVTRPRHEALPLVNGLQDRAEAAGQAVAVIHCLALRALLAGRGETDEAYRLARLALDRCMTTGRVDFARSLRRRLGHLLILSRSSS
ncbi:MAG TPA: hypothetical protein VD969_27610 [Symbiobacteriaceae bacterium]|nr:hypothetical protein [Symbiobacteriaceae bacterium]